MPPGTNISSYYITAVFTTSDEGPAGLGVVEVRTYFSVPRSMLIVY